VADGQAQRKDKRKRRIGQTVTEEVKKESKRGKKWRGEDGVPVCGLSNRQEPKERKRLRRKKANGEA
jgi:hypothetical protein